MWARRQVEWLNVGPEMERRERTSLSDELARVVDGEECTGSYYATAASRRVRLGPRFGFVVTFLCWAND